MSAAHDRDAKVPTTVGRTQQPVDAAAEQRSPSRDEVVVAPLLSPRHERASVGRRSSARPVQLLGLQRSAGNRAVTRMVDRLVQRVKVSDAMSETLYNKTTPNTGQATANLVGMSLVFTNFQTTNRFTIGVNTFLDPQKYLVIWFDNETNAAGIHTGYNLPKSTGGNLLLIAPDGVTILDYVRDNGVNAGFGLQVTDLTIGRVPDGTGVEQVQAQDAEQKEGADENRGQASFPVGEDAEAHDQPQQEPVRQRWTFRIGDGENRPMGQHQGPAPAAAETPPKVQSADKAAAPSYASITMFSPCFLPLPLREGGRGRGRRQSAAAPS
jgi:hypothetical protein